MPATKHIRQQIRERFQTLLTGLTTTGARVYMTRTNPLSQDETELPCWLIGADPANPTTDRVVQRSGGSQVTALNKSTQRTMHLPIQGWHKAANSVENIENTLDTMAKEAEIALFADPLLSGLAAEMRLMDSTISVNGDGDAPVGDVLMNFEVDYWCVEGAPDVVI